MSDERVWHYVRPNETTRVPRMHIFLDSESTSERTKTGHRQTWRCAVATYRDAPKGRNVKRHQTVYSDPSALWADVSAFTKPRNRTILWAHNLGYDVRITDAWRVLPALGWRIVAHNLAPRGTWIHWTRDGATLLMVDSTSVFPVSLAELAKSHMLAKVRLPGEESTMDQWVARCRRDVDILETAMVAYLDWLESADLGNWQMTGAGQSYAIFRHKHLTHTMLVHADSDALTAERRAMWTGRCEAYWKGRTGHVGVEEWDLSLAYPRLVRDHSLPTRLVGPIPSNVDLQAALARPRTAILAEVDIETSVPCVPCEVDGRMAWPVGHFTTTLWAPELALAIQTGARVRVRRAWLYAADPALKQWAEWIIDALRPDNDVTQPWQRIILKHHARALIGRFGMQYKAWQRFGVTEELATRHSTVYDVQSGATYELSHIGRDVFTEAGTVEWGQSQPAITGYVMSLARVQLWHIIQAMPPRSVLYVDTDSMYTTGEFHDAALALSRTPVGDGLRLKTSYLRAEILGPRQIITDARPRVAGIPSKAVMMADGSLVGEVWESLQSTMRRGTPNAVVTTDRRWKIGAVDHRRIGGPSGWTEPITVDQRR